MVVVAGIERYMFAHVTLAHNGSQAYQETCGYTFGSNLAQTQISI